MIRFAVIQSRVPAAVAAVGLALVAVVLAVSGPHLVHLYDAGLASCGPTGNCAAVTAAFDQNDRSLQIGLNALVIVAPGLIGMFWGAPLVARELETGTYRLAWTQGVSRSRWLAAKLGVVGLAGMALAGLLSLAVTWWSSPFDRVAMSPFGSFDQRGVVPAGYAAFAIAAGVTAGLLIRRTLPAMAATLAAFVGVRAAVTHWARPYLLAPLHVIVPDTIIPAGGISAASAGAPSPLDWVLSNQTVNGAGRVIGRWGTVGSGNEQNSAGPRGVVIGGAGSCPGIRTAPGGNAAQASTLIQRCVNQLRIRELLTYQPSGRYWPFQWFELAIFMGASVILASFCFWWIRRRIA